jgi:putative endonuclease
MDERVYFAYIVASRSRTLYIGMTGDLRVRVYQHKQRLRPDGFGATYNCDRLVWFERFMDPSNAIDREKQLKGWRRSKKIVLIESKNPTWEVVTQVRSRSFDSAEVRFAQDDSLLISMGCRGPTASPHRAG